MSATQVQRWLLECDECHAIIYLDYNPAAEPSRIESHGWALNFGVWLCPHCVDTAIVERPDTSET